MARPKSNAEQVRQDIEHYIDRKTEPLTDKEYLEVLGDLEDFVHICIQAKKEELEEAANEQPG